MTLCPTHTHTHTYIFINICLRYMPYNVLLGALTWSSFSATWVWDPNLYPVLQCWEIKVCVTKTKAYSSHFTFFGWGIKFLCQLRKFLLFFFFPLRCGQAQGYPPQLQYWLLRSGRGCRFIKYVHKSLVAAFYAFPRTSNLWILKWKERLKKQHKWLR